MRIALLHTAESNIAVFETARLGLELHGLALNHHVRPDLLAEAEAAGGLTPALAERTRAELLRLGDEADSVILTCSTLGPAIAGTPAVRVDEALARRAVRDGGRVVALCTIAATMTATRELFAEAALATGAQPETRLVPGVWAVFQQGDIGRYWMLIAAAADAALREGTGVVALAQASMAGAAALCREPGMVLTSPEAGLLDAQNRFAPLSCKACLP